MDFLYSHLNEYIFTELQHESVAGPFKIKPFSEFSVSPLHTVPKKGSDSSSRRVVLDLSYPTVGSVNSGIPRDSYMNEQLELQYPSVDDFGKLIVAAGRGSYMYKRDLSTAFQTTASRPHGL